MKDMFLYKTSARYNWLVYRQYAQVLEHIYRPLLKQHTDPQMVHGWFRSFIEWIQQSSSMKGIRHPMGMAAQFPDWLHAQPEAPLWSIELAEYASLIAQMADEGGCEVRGYEHNVDEVYRGSAPLKERPMPLVIFRTPELNVSVEGLNPEDARFILFNKNMIGSHELDETTYLQIKEKWQKRGLVL